MRLIYCYDAYCGWCYGFSDVIKQLNETVGEKIPIEVLSGGMLLPEYPMPVQMISEVILDNYRRVEEYTGITFGEDFLWHARHADQSDWFPNSLPPAIALCIIKEKHPEKAVDFALDIEYGLNYEGRDLTDREAYRHLLAKYDFTPEEFFEKMGDTEYASRARNEFDICRQLQVTSFPALLLQANESKFFLLAKGYTPYQTIIDRLDNIINEIRAQLN